MTQEEAFKNLEKVREERLAAIARREAEEPHPFNVGQKVFINWNAGRERGVYVGLSHLGECLRIKVGGTTYNIDANIITEA